MSVEDPMSKLLQASSWQELISAQNAIIVQLPRDIRKRLNKIGSIYKAAYGFDGWYERFNRRSIATILAEFVEHPEPEPLESGEEGGVRYTLYDAPKGNSGGDRSSPTLEGVTELDVDATIEFRGPSPVTLTDQNLSEYFDFSAKNSAEFRESYVDILSSVGVELRPDDGCATAEIEKAEQGLGVEIPSSLREYYLVAGRETRINQLYNRLLLPEKWFVDSNRLVFMEENRSTVFWGIGAGKKPASDAVVFQGVNHRTEGIEWFVEHQRCSVFLRVMAVWHASFGGAAAFNVVGYVDETATRNFLDRSCELLGEVNQMRAYRHADGVISFLKWEDRFQKLRRLPPWRVFIAAANATKLDSIKNSLTAQWDKWGD